MGITIMDTLRARGIGVGKKLEGTAVVGDVRATKTFMNAEGGPLSGSLVTRDGGGAIAVTPGANAQTLQPGIYDYSIAVAGDADLATWNIRAGVTLFGIVGKSTVLDTADATAIAANIILNKTAYVNGMKVTGAMAEYGDIQIPTASQPNTQITTIVNAGNGIDGAIFFKAGVTGHINLNTLLFQYIKNMRTENIKAGVKVGNDTTFMTGTFTSDADAVAGNILLSKTAYVNGVKVTGTIPSKAATTIIPSTVDQTIAAGLHLSGIQTIIGDADLVTGNIRAGVTLFGVVGKSSVVDTADATAAADNILATKIAYINGSKVTGTMPNRAGNQVARGVLAQGGRLYLYTLDGAYNATDSTVYADDADFVAGNILATKNIFGLQGNIPQLGSEEYPGYKRALHAYSHPTRMHFYIPPGAYLTGTADAVNQAGAPGNYVGVFCDNPEFIASNILDTANIFGLQGTAIAGLKFASGSAVTGGRANFPGVNPSSGPSSFSVAPITVSGLSFKPTLIIIYDPLAANTGHYSAIYMPSIPAAAPGYMTVQFQGAAIHTNETGGGSAYVTDTGFYMPASYTEGRAVKWIAIQLGSTLSA